MSEPRPELRNDIDENILLVYEGYLKIIEDLGYDIDYRLFVIEIMRYNIKCIFDTYDVCNSNYYIVIENILKILMDVSLKSRYEHNYRIMVLDLVSYITDNLHKAVQKNRLQDRLPQREHDRLPQNQLPINQLPSNIDSSSMNDQMSKKQKASMLDPKAKEFYPKNFELDLGSELESEKILYEQKKLVDKVIDYVLIENE